MKVATTTGLTPIVLRYIPKSWRKENPSPFSECSVSKSMVYFHYTKHATAIWLQHLSLVLLLLQEACYKKKVAYQACAHVMGLSQMCTSWWRRAYGLNDTQKMIQRQGGKVATLRIGFSYIPSQLVKILGRRKEKPLLAAIHHDGRSWGWWEWPCYIEFKAIDIRQVTTVYITTTPFCVQHDVKR